MTPLRGPIRGVIRHVAHSLTGVGLTLVLAILLGASPPAAADEPAAEPPEEEKLSEMAARYFCSYKPNYLILGLAEKGRSNPTTKFQFSFQAMLLDLSKPGETPDSCAKPAHRHFLHFGYSQKSIWNLYAASAPFEENNYNPEFFYGYHVKRWGIGWATFGIEHESNGEGGTDSRSWNRLYARAQWNFAIDDSFHVLKNRPNDRRRWYAGLEAKVWWAFDKDDDQVNLNKYIGYGILRGVVNSREYDWGSVAFDVEVTKGGNPIEYDHASVQLGASYRQPRVFGRFKLVPFFYLQYFEGYGETLIRADQHTRALRGGIRLIL